MDKLLDIELYNDDCFNVFPQLEKKSVNLFLLDLPYNQTSCKWDFDIIPLDKMWDNIKRVMKPNGIVVMFCTAKFGYRLIHSNPKWFRYDLIWKKSRKVGFLSANKMPLRQHENIYLFSNQNEYDEENEQLKFNKNKILVDYSKKVFTYIQKTKKQIIKDIPHADHFFRWSRGNFNIPTEKTYNKLIELYGINNMCNFIPYETLKEMWDGKKETDTLETTYNPQKTEGKPYKTVEASLTNSYYRGGDKEYKTKPTENKGDRHPTSLIDYDGDSILIYKNPHKTIHRTQKPVELCEWLIKTYSNERDTVMDFTMGSATVGIACLNTNRKFIGVEKDKEIYEKAEDRLMKHLEL